MQTPRTFGDYKIEKSNKKMEYVDSLMSIAAPPTSLCLSKVPKVQTLSERKLFRSQHEHL
jgi:hypothetical protein